MIKNKFWTKSDTNKITINQFELLTFLQSSGFYQVKKNSLRILVKETNNIIEEVQIADLKKYIKDYLLRKKEFNVLEQFMRGSSSYINASKIEFLDDQKLCSDKDSNNEIRFFFRNGFCKITKEGIEFCDYSKLYYKIWRSRIIDFELNHELLNTSKKGQFEQFIELISSNDDNDLANKRKESLMSIVGYLQHRNNISDDNNCVILYDEKMFENSLANGGTGKSLLVYALKNCREVVEIDGKKIKENSNFDNQLINVTTDIVAYDDLQKYKKFDFLFSKITSGIEIEKKNKQTIKLDKKDSPKYLITSNHYVKGTPGSSNDRRRWEFALTNFFDVNNTPESFFGNRFFDNH